MSFPSVRIAAFQALLKCVKAVKFIPNSEANIFPEYILPRLLPLCHDRNDLVRAAFASNIAEVRSAFCRKNRSLFTKIRVFCCCTDCSTSGAVLGPGHAVQRIHGERPGRGGAGGAVVRDRADGAARLHRPGGDGVAGRQRQLRQAGPDGPRGHQAGRLFWQTARQRHLAVAHDHFSQRQGRRAAPALVLRQHRRRGRLRGVAVLPHFETAAAAGSVRPGGVRRQPLHRHHVQSDVAGPVAEGGRAPQRDGAAAAASVRLDPARSSRLRGVGRPAHGRRRRCRQNRRHRATVSSKARAPTHQTRFDSGSAGTPSSLQRLRHSGQAQRRYPDGLDPAFGGAIEGPCPSLQVVKVRRDPASPGGHVPAVGVGRDGSFHGRQDLELKGPPVEVEPAETRRHAGVLQGQARRRRRVRVEAPRLSAQRRDAGGRCVVPVRFRGQSLVTLPRSGRVQDQRSLHPGRRERGVATYVRHRRRGLQTVAQALCPSGFAGGGAQTPQSPPAESEASVAQSRRARGARGASQQRCVQPGCVRFPNVSDILDHVSGCKLALDQLLEKKRVEFHVNSRKNNSIEYGLSNRNSPAQGWRPKGYLVAHLHEHQGYISNLTRIPDKPLFASGSSDGCIRVSY